MEFSISQKELLECLNHFQSVVERRNTIPILSNLKIIAEDGTLSITATDLGIELTEKLNAKIDKNGSTTIPSQLFFDIVRKIPERLEIKIKKDDKSQVVYVLFGKSQFSIPTLPIDDFPLMDESKFDVNLELKSSELKELINNCKFCMGLDESRPYLNGIYFHVSGEKISTVSTDGHRLSKSTLNQKYDNSFDGVIVPKKTVLEISKILDEFDLKVNLSFSKTRLKVDLDKIKIISKLINSSFPDYESVIPKDNDQIMTVDCKSFAETIDRVSTISNEKFRTVKFDISENTCIVSSFGTDKSVGTENFAVDFQGTGVSINFNARYILDVLSLMKAGKVKFYFSKNTAPTVLECETLKNSIFLIMQMRA